MKPWLRLTLITNTVGGGFAGLVLTSQYITDSQNRPASYYCLLLGFSVLYVFVIIGGLTFVHNAQRTVPLIVAIAIQIPWFSSPIIAYRFVAGLQVGVGFFGGHFSSVFLFGSVFQVNFFQPFPWGGGINLFALALLVLLVQARLRGNVQILPPQPEKD